MRTMLLIWSFLALYALSDVHGRTVQIDWTLLGVANYRDPSNPLRTELGDSLILLCENVSNLFIQAEKIQHEECNASAGSGQYDLNGFCTASGELRLSLTVNSQNLMNTINFENNHLYYFASYSNGRLGDANNRSINSGGQCEDGLKMVVLIGENPTTFTPDIGGNKPGDPGGDDLPIAIIAGAAGGGVAFIILIVFLCICICLCCCKKAVKVNQEEPDTTMDVKLIVTTDTTQTQINPSEGTRNATNNNTTQNRTGAASSPSQQNKASRGTVHNGCTYHKGAAQSTAGSLVADDKHVKPHNAPNTYQTAGSSVAGDKRDKPHNAPSSHRPAGSSIAGDKRDKPHNAPSSHRPAGSSVAGDKRDKPHNAPSSHRPAGSSVAGDKHDKPHNAPISHRPAPPPPSNTATTGLSRTQRSKNGVSYETKNDAVKL